MSAHAQVTPKAAAPEDTALQEVVVTGSRIARPEFDNLEPTTTVDSKTFDQRGYLDVGQALNELPAFGVAPSSAANTQAGFGIAQSFVDLYGLGSQRTLTLVNGRRFVSESTASLSNANANTNNGGNGTQVDLNVIPTKLIDHVEVVSVGGAPIYGADAIAGVVNIILKKDYQGLDVDGQVGASGQGDAWNYRTRILGGQNLFDGRANITGGGGVHEDRRSGRYSASGVCGGPGLSRAGDAGQVLNSVLTPANSVPQVSFGGIPLVDDTILAPAIGLTGSVVGVTNAAGQTLAFGPNGQLQPYNTGTDHGKSDFRQRRRRPAALDGQQSAVTDRAHQYRYADALSDQRPPQCLRRRVFLRIACDEFDLPARLQHQLCSAQPAPPPAISSSASTIRT